MSKQSVAKTKQEFQQKPVWPECRSCSYFKLDTVEEKTYFGKYTKETNLRCFLGSFRVGKTSTCNCHVPKKTN
jgi:hypothetical protein